MNDRHVRVCEIVVLEQQRLAADPGECTAKAVAEILAGERQLRPLAKLDTKEQQAEAWQMAEEIAGR